MKKKFLKIAVAVIGCCILATSVTFAISTMKSIDVYYQDIKLVVNGVPVTPKDANGNVVEPFIHNGTTYLPVRAVGNALGQKVDWDGATNTVYLGDVPGALTYLAKDCPAYEANLYYTPNTFTMAGESYTNGFVMDGNNKSYAIFNLNDQYSTLEFDIGHIDGEDMRDAKYDIFLDGEYYTTIEAGAEDMVKHVTIPVDGVLQLKIDSSGYTAYEYYQYGFANAVLS